MYFVHNMLVSVHACACDVYMCGKPEKGTW